MRYTVGFDDEARETLGRLSPTPKAEVNKVVRRLRHDPDRRFDLELMDADNRYRAYAGRRWRVIFSVLPGRHIQIRRISRRLGAYKGMEHPGYRELQEPQAPYSAEGTSVPAATAD